MINHQNPPTSKIILHLLATAGGTAVDFWHMMYDLRYNRSAYLKGGHAYVSEIKHLQNKVRARVAINNLKRYHYLITRRRGQRLIVTLTDKGLAATLGERLRETKLLSDGTYTVVSFDIPESERSARRHFRWLLRQGGFQKLQQSVWISPHDVHKEVSIFAKRMKIESWVTVFYGSGFSALSHSIR